MNTSIVTKSQVLCRSRNFRWTMNFFVGGFAALVLGLVSGIYALAGLGFVAMLVTLTIMRESITEKVSKRLCSWRGRTLSE